MNEYPLAIFDRPVPLPKLDHWHWRRRFTCPDPACEGERTAAGGRGRRVLGRQQIRKWTQQGGSVQPGAPIVAPTVGYLIEKVWLARELTDLANLADGRLSFGLPEGARDQPELSSRARAIPVLASAGPTPFGPSSGDPYWINRDDPRRARGGTGYWVIALTFPAAARPFVVTCPDCRRRCLIDGSLPEDELRQLDEHPA
ncbi:MAG TPA: hypothetical protein VNF73_10900 [Candidatus Saccharimonadales bacterium]|nr:hypothetical protein [Candidatus Saccharimonadales bacterium]